MQMHTIDHSWLQAQLLLLVLLRFFSRCALLCETIKREEWGIVETLSPLLLPVLLLLSGIACGCCALKNWRASFS
jgi:hypothetical protein